MKILFDNLSGRVSKITTHTYSTSFSLGIYMLNSRLRDAIYAIYGFVRLADEIVDSFHGYDQQTLLSKLRTETFEAIQNRISVNPILHSFQRAVWAYNIEPALIDTFMKSMEMDLLKIEYTQEKYEEYILGSAEVVGLMCLHVFTEGDQQLYDELKPFAMRLGAAFQKVNFLRDMRDDNQLLGRTYFPGVDISRFNGQVKSSIEQDIEQDFAAALKGIKRLPASSRSGVYLAYVYYTSLFNKIKKVPAQHLMTTRVRINNGRKIGLMLNSLLVQKMNWL